MRIHDTRFWRIRLRVALLRFHAFTLSRSLWPPAPEHRTPNTEHLSSVQPKTPREVLDQALTLAAIILAELVVALRPFKSGVAYGFEANTLIAMVILVAAFLWLMRMVLDGRLVLARTGFGLPILLFAAVIVLSFFTSTYKRPSIVQGSNWLAYLALFVFLANLCRGNTLWTIVLRALLASALVVALYGFYQRFVGLADMRALFEKDPAGLMRTFNLPPETLDDFRARIYNDRVFSTFVVPNTLAGFLILVIPVQLGFLLDLLTAKTEKGTQLFSGKELRPLFALSANAISFAALVACMFLTKSKGGWLALAIALAFFLFMLRRHFLARHKGKLVAAAGVLVAALVAAQVAGHLPKLGEYAGSLEVRHHYWRGALLIIRDNFWLGTGLDTFGDNYALYKRPEDGESQKAHNDFLQIGAETGIFGLLAFVWICAVFLRRHAAWGMAHGPSPQRPITPAPQHPSTPAGEDPKLVLMALGIGVLCFVIDYYAFGTFASFERRPRWLPSVAFCAAWIALYLANSQAAATRCFQTGFRYGRLGMVSGVLGVMIHSLAEFDQYDHGVAQTFWVLLAILAATADTPTRERGIGNLGQMAVTAASVAGFVLIALFVPRVLQAGVHADLAEKAAKARRYAQAVEDWRRAEQLDPWDARTHIGLADAYWMLMEQGQETHQGQPCFKLAVQHVERAIALNPRSASHHVLLGRFCERGARRAPEFLVIAQREYERAVQLYPSKPIYHVHLARVLEKLGRPSQAASEYETAISLSKRQRYPRNELNAKTMQNAEERLKALRPRG